MKISVWEKLQKEMTWHQIGEHTGKRILDFGSGNGMTADYYAENNEVIAVEPGQETIKVRFSENNYIQLCGSIDKLYEFEDNYFDIILCHNVLEHANELLDGKSGNAEKYGAINYYNDEDIIKWSDKFVIKNIFGQRTFWDLQQNQDIQDNIEWQKKIFDIENRVSDIEGV